MNTQRNKEIVKLMKNKMSLEVKEFFRLVEKRYNNKQITKKDYDIFFDDYVQRIENFADYYDCEIKAEFNNEALLKIYKEGYLSENEFSILQKEFSMLDKLGDKMGDFETLLFEANPSFLQAFGSEYEEMVEGLCFLTSVYEKRFKDFDADKKLNHGDYDTQKIVDAMICGDDTKEYSKKVEAYYQTFVEPQMQKCLYFKLYAKEKLNEITNLATEINHYRTQEKSVKVAKLVGLTKKDVMKEIVETQKVLIGYEQSMQCCFVENEALTKNIKNIIKTKEVMMKKKCSEISHKIDAAQTYKIVTGPAGLP